MAYNEELEQRLNFALQLFPNSITQHISKKRMFGGLAIMYKGKMTVGIVKNDLMVRVIGKKMEDVLKQQAVRPMDFTKRPMKEFIYVSTKGFETEEQLQNWIELGIEHAQSKTQNIK
jgi:TfoX/Sxy family transcriptional regulator of competence genes